MYRLRVLLLSAVFASAALAVPTATPAAADYCHIRIKWDEKSQQWQWAGDADWECELCVPGIVVPPELTWDAVERYLPVRPPALGSYVDTVNRTVGNVVDVARDAAGAGTGTPYPVPLPDGPECPLGWEPREDRG